MISMLWRCWWPWPTWTAMPSRENGAAAETPPESGRWVYTATATVDTGNTVRITVTAEDRPGGLGTGEGEKAL